MIAREVRVSGRVQGVFFRDTCARRARELGVCGWVGNEPDGSVRAHVEGPGAAVEALIEWCHEGSPGARVDRVRVFEAEPTGAHSFEVR